LLIASLAGAFLPAVKGNSACDQTDTFTITRDLLKSFYPEIFDEHRYINISTGQPVDNDIWNKIFGFQFKVVRFAPDFPWNPTFDVGTGKVRGTPENTSFLQGSTWIGYHGEILHFVLNGELAHSRQNETLRELVDSHPEWSEKQAIRALKNAGAQYGPAEKQQFIDSLHLDRAEKALGHLEIKLVEFDGVSSEHVGNFARFFWIVHAQGQTPGGAHRNYGLSFEPFAGRLTTLNEIRNPQDDDGKP
jgi:hypothetical protein